MSERLAGMVRRQAQMDLSGELTHPAADFAGAPAERVQRHALGARLHPPAAQGVEQTAGRPVQQQPDLVGQEAMAGDAAGFRVG